MEKVSNFESFISLQLAYCDEFFTFIHEKSDKRKVYDLDNTVEGKILCLNCYQVKEQELIN